MESDGGDPNRLRKSPFWRRKVTEERWKRKEEKEGKRRNQTGKRCLNLNRKKMDGFGHDFLKNCGDSN